jgi:hypothetical protein
VFPDELHQSSKVLNLSSGNYTVKNGSSLTLADLIRLDWAIAEQGKLVKMTKRSIAALTAAGVDSLEQVKALAVLEQAVSSLNRKREEVRKTLLRPN